MRQFCTFCDCVYGLVESIFVIYTSPYNAENERVFKKYFQGALFLCLQVRGKKNQKEEIQMVKYQFTEKLIDLNLSIVLFILLLYLLLHLSLF